MQDKLLANVVLHARKLILSYKQINRGLPCPIALNPGVRKGWTGDPERTGCINAAERLLGKRIEIFNFPPMGVENPIAALVHNYEDRAEIYISSAQNYCWQRFLAAKELAHLLICEKANQTPITPGEISSLLSDLINNVFPGENRILQAESYAYYAAIEILLPMEHALDAAQRLNAGDSILELAKKYRMPRKAMELRLTDPTAIALFNAVYESHAFRTLGLTPQNA